MGTLSVQVLKWLGTFFTLCGAIFTSLNIDPLNVLLFNFGSAAWLMAAIQMKYKSLIVVNSGLLAVYAFGIFYRI
jgi:hypothetical protein